MGKKLVGVIAFAAIAAVAGWNYQQNKQEVQLSDLALENAEALASSEGCTNRPGENNGECVTNGKGEYFCANASNRYDCVK